VSDRFEPPRFRREHKIIEHAQISLQELQLIVSLQDGSSTADGVMMDNDNDDNDDDDGVDENNHDRGATNFHREKSEDPNTIHDIFDIHANNDAINNDECGSFRAPFREMTIENQLQLPEYRLLPENRGITKNDIQCECRYDDGNTIIKLTSYCCNA